MKTFLKNTTAITVALLVLFSTLSFTVEKHFCCGELVDVSYFGDADNCGMPNGKCLFIKKKCCSDEIHKIEGQNELNSDTDFKLQFKKVQFLAAFFVSYQNLFLENKFDKIVFNDFSPPDIPINYQVLYQVFLI